MSPKQYATAAAVLQRMAGMSQVQAQDWLEQAVEAEIQAVLEIDVTPTPAERLQMVLDHHADRRRAESQPAPPAE